MIYKSTKVIFSLLFLFFLVGLFFTFFFYKQKEINKALENSKKEILYRYSEVFRNYFEFGELIYFNEFVRNKTILDILKNPSTDKKKEIYESSVDSFAFYSNLSLYNVSFYDSNKDLILTFNEKKDVPKEFLSKNDNFSFISNHNRVYLTFFKPIFDEKLNFVGVITLEFLFDDFIKKLQKELGLKFIYTISKDKIEEFNKDFIYLEIFETNDNAKLYLITSNENLAINSINKFYIQFLFMATLCFLALVFVILKVFDYKANRDLVIKNYQEFFEHMDEHILRLDTDLEGNIEYVSDAYCKITGYRKDELVGKNASILRHPDISNNFYKNIWHELKTKNIWEGEIKNRDKFGNTYWIKSVIFPKYNLKNEVIGFRSIRFDITSIKQLEKINRLLKEDLSNKLNKLKLNEKIDMDVVKVELMSKIVDSMSHLWKEPISKISLELQKIDNISIKNLISKELFSLSNMLNEFKSIFKHSAEKTNLLEILNEVKLALKDEINENKISLKLSKDLDVNLDISRNELKNIIINISRTQLECLKLSSSSEVSIQISILSETSDEDIIIKIEDNIRKDKINSYFEELLNSKDDKFFDTSIHLAKLLIEKNSGLFWYKNSVSDTIYYIKLRKDLL